MTRFSGLGGIRIISDHLSQKLPTRLKAVTSLIGVLVVVGGLSVQSQPASAQASLADVSDQITISDEKAFLGADEVWYDDKKRLIGAKGSVELFQGEKGITADELHYYLDEEKVVAKGNVAIVEPGGSVLFADEINLDKDLKRGYIRQIGMLLSDGTRAAAVNGIRRSETVIELQKAVFSPCPNCKNDPTKPLFWQMEADQIILDDDLQEVFYKNARFKLLGVPLFWTPYFRHADPRVDRKSGFLLPAAKYSSDLGFVGGIRYFQTLGTSTDLLLEPTVYSKGAFSLGGTLRHRFDDALIELQAHGTYLDPDRRLSAKILETGHESTEGMIKANGWWDINETWRASFDGTVTTDTLYLKDLDINSSNIIENTALLEGFHGRSYTSVAAYDYQLAEARLTSTEDTFPSVLPEAQHLYLSEPGERFGELWKFDFETRYLTRETGRDSLKISGRAGIEIPYQTSDGHLFRFEANLRADYYDVTGQDPNSNDVNPLASVGLYSGSVDRFYPEGKIEWRYPSVRRGDKYSQIVEPIVSFTATPNDNDLSDGRIPNEDSVNFQLDPSNLFDINRYSGTDVVDTGQRLNYGVNWSLYESGQKSLKVFAGQSYDFTNRSTAVTTSGIEEEFSDVVGHVQYRQQDNIPIGALGEIKNFQVDYLTRYDVDDASFKRNEVLLQGSAGDLFAKFSYIALDFDNGFITRDREQLTGLLTYQLTDDWSVGGYYSRDLETDESLLASSYVRYENDCFSFKLTGAKLFSAIEDEYTVGAVIEFTHLGIFDIAGTDFSQFLDEDEDQ